MYDMALDTPDLGGLGLQAGAQPAPPAEKTPQVAAAITQWINRIDSDLEFHRPAFERMQEDIDRAKGKQWPGQTDADERYVANITRSVIKQRVASLYAKDPTISANLVERMDFEIWDEQPESLQAALQDPTDPLALQLLQDIVQGYQRREQLEKIAKTLELVIKNQIRNQQPTFKGQMKRMLRREETTGIGYIKIDFMRELDVRPDIEAEVSSLSNRLSQIKSLVEGLEVGEYDNQSAEAEQLEQTIDGLREQMYVLKKEGIVYRFPRSTDIIPDKNCTQVDGWVGADHLTERFRLTDEQIRRYWDVDPQEFTAVTMAGKPNDKWKLMAKDRGNDDNRRDVFIVHDKISGTRFVIARGCDYYLEAPGPEPLLIEQFYPIFGLQLNEVEDEDCIFAPSTGRLMWHQQQEYNRSKEALRVHRIAMKPLYAGATGALTENDKKNIAEHEAHDMIELDNLQENQTVESKFQMVKKHNIDPNVYETSTTYDDVTKVVQMPPASIGAISKSTATEAGIAQGATESNTVSDSDDQDDFLSLVMRESGHAALMNLSPETVKKIAGRGAVWPEFDPAEVIEDIYLDIEGGSSGRRNSAAEAALLQRLYPLLIQVPGFRPQWYAKKISRILGDNIDFSDMYLEGVPSIMAMNAMNGGQPGTGNPQTDPSAQGARGANNAPAAQRADRPTQATMPGGGADTAAQQAGGMMAGR